MSARLERGDRRRAVPQPSHEWLSFTGGPAIRDQPKIHSATVYRPSQTPHLPLSPERVTPGGCRALDTRSESPLGARLPASPAEATRRGAPAKGTPTGTAAEVIREKGPARVQSRRQPPPTASPRRPAFHAAADTAPRKPTPYDARGAADASPARRAAHRASGGGERRATERLLPQPRREPSPASHPSPTDPALRANPYPEVTDLTCRLPLAALF
ncbi:hypothetical protein ACER0C_022339 [Sarotherodon galilaeus]